MANLILLPVIKPDANKLDEAYEVNCDFEVNLAGVTVCVPLYFQFDGASIPAAGWQLIGTPFNPKFMRGAVVHDWLYHTHQVPREAADDILYRLLVESKVNKVKASLIYDAVRLAGEFYWPNDKDDKAYLKRLHSRLVAEGKPTEKYHFPAGITG